MADKLHPKTGQHVFPRNMVHLSSEKNIQRVSNQGYKYTLRGGSDWFFSVSDIALSATSERLAAAYLASIRIRWGSRDGGISDFSEAGCQD